MKTHAEIAQELGREPLLPFAEAATGRLCQNCRGHCSRPVRIRPGDMPGAWKRMYVCTACTIEASSAGMVIIRSVR